MTDSNNTSSIIIFNNTNNNNNYHSKSTTSLIDFAENLFLIPPENRQLNEISFLISQLNFTQISYDTLEIQVRNGIYSNNISDIHKLIASYMQFQIYQETHKEIKHKDSCKFQCVAVFEGQVKVFDWKDRDEVNPLLIFNKGDVFSEKNIMKLLQRSLLITFAPNTCLGVAKYEDFQETLLEIVENYEDTKIVRSADLFQYLSQSQFNKLLVSVSKKVFSKGENVFKSGEEITNIFIIKSGEFEVSAFINNNFLNMIEDVLFEKKCTDYSEGNENLEVEENTSELTNIFEFRRKFNSKKTMTTKVMVSQEMFGEQEIIKSYCYSIGLVPPNSKREFSVKCLSTQGELLSIPSNDLRIKVLEQIKLENLQEILKKCEFKINTYQNKIKDIKQCVFPFQQYLLSPTKQQISPMCTPSSLSFIRNDSSTGIREKLRSKVKNYQSEKQNRKDKKKSAHQFETGNSIIKCNLTAINSKQIEESQIKDSDKLYSLQQKQYLSEKVIYSKEKSRSSFSSHPNVCQIYEQLSSNSQPQHNQVQNQNFSESVTSIDFFLCQPNTVKSISSTSQTLQKQNLHITPQAPIFSEKHIMTSRNGKSISLKETNNSQKQLEPAEQICKEYLDLRQNGNITKQMKARKLSFVEPSSADTSQILSKKNNLKIKLTLNNTCGLGMKLPVSPTNSITSQQNTTAIGNACMYGSILGSCTAISQAQSNIIKEKKSVGEKVKKNQEDLDPSSFIQFVPLAEALNKKPSENIITYSGLNTKATHDVGDRKMKIKLLTPIFSRGYKENFEKEMIKLNNKNRKPNYINDFKQQKSKRIDSNRYLLNQLFKDKQQPALFSNMTIKPQQAAPEDSINQMHQISRNPSLTNLTSQDPNSRSNSQNIFKPTSQENNQPNNLINNPTGYYFQRVSPSNGLNVNQKRASSLENMNQPLPSQLYPVKGDISQKKFIRNKGFSGQKSKGNFQESERRNNNKPKLELSYNIPQQQFNSLFQTTSVKSSKENILPFNLKFNDH